MRLILDCREKKLIDICTALIKSEECFKSIVMISKNLELGDIVIEGDDEKEIIIIERKSFNDLASSIKDGRYAEQSFRLQGYDFHNHNIMYLVEGDNINKHQSKQIIYSSLLSLNYYKGFSIFRTISVQETALVILNWFNKIVKEKGKPSYYKVYKEYKIDKADIEDEDKEDAIIGSGIEEDKSESYCTVVKKKKNANITQDNFVQIVLCQIPSVSSVTAVAISNEYKTLNSLMNSLKEDPKCLDNMTYNTSTGTKRKLSKTCVKNIIHYLNQ